ncbi:MAG: cbb3-type cytochrome c oxidase N-terminal domain-containing protein [Fidelibacterota bacterium]
MSAKPKDLLLDHNYDGIQELDNDLPPWWLMMFYFTIAFAVVYFMYYQVLGIGPTMAEEYQLQMNPNAVLAETPGSGIVFQSPYDNKIVDLTPRMRKELSRFVGEEVPFSVLIAEAKRKASPDQLEKLNAAFPGNEFGTVSVAAAPTVEEAPPALERFTDPENLAKGKAIFEKNCIPCHAADGGGGIGPNLTDEYWLHGGAFQDIAHTITVGVPAKGMIPWGKSMNRKKIQLVASFVASLQGTTPANPKAPQGERMTAIAP